MSQLGCQGATKARKNLELKLAVDIKRNPKSFYKMFVPKQNLRREFVH